MEEVRFQYLRPAQVVERREKCSVAYIPLGTLEWHGLHNPMGVDALQAEEVAIRCARKGGVAMPPVYWGESRAVSLLETNPDYMDGVAQRMGVPVSNFSVDKQPFTAYQQMINYQNLLTHILCEVAAYGFEMAVFVVGHYPLIDHARAAILLYNQWCFDQGKHMNVWVFGDFELLKETGLYEHPGDHGGPWETSHLLAICPEAVDMELTKKELQYGIMGEEDPADSTAEYGNEIYDAAVEIAVSKIKYRMEHPEEFTGHGLPVY